MSKHELTWPLGRSESATSTSVGFDSDLAAALRLSLAKPQSSLCIAGLVAMTLISGGARASDPPSDSYRQLPTSTLLDRQDNGDSQATAELEWRHSEGKLSLAEIDQAIKRSCHLCILGRSRVPLGKSWAFRLQYRSDLYGGWISQEKTTVSIDGRPIRSLDENSFPSEVTAALLPVGPHEITIHMDRPCICWGKTTPVSMSCSQQVLVEDKPAGDLVKGVTDEKTRKAVLSAINATANYCKSDPSKTEIMLTRKGTLPVGIAGRLLWRPSGDDKFLDRDTGTGRHTTPPISFVGIGPQLPHGSKFIEQVSGMGQVIDVGQETTAIDVELLPSLDAVFCYPDISDRYFAAPLIWKHIPVLRPKPRPAGPEVTIATSLDEGSTKLTDALSQFATSWLKSAPTADQALLKDKLLEAFRSDHPRLKLRFFLNDLNTDGPFQLDTEAEFENVNRSAKFKIRDPRFGSVADFQIGFKVILNFVTTQWQIDGGYEVRYFLTARIRADVTETWPTPASIRGGDELMEKSLGFFKRDGEQLVRCEQPNG